MPARIARPLPIKPTVPDSGTVVLDDPQPEMVFVSSVTAPFLASVEPHVMEAPVVRVMLIIAAYTHEILFSCHPGWAITPPSPLVRRRKRRRASG